MYAVYSYRGYINKQCMDMSNNWVPQKPCVSRIVHFDWGFGWPPCGFQTSILWYRVYTLPKTHISPEDWLEDEFFFWGWPIFRTHIVRDHLTKIVPKNWHCLKKKHLYKHSIIRFELPGCIYIPTNPNRWILHWSIQLSENHWGVQLPQHSCSITILRRCRIPGVDLSLALPSLEYLLI